MSRENWKSIQRCDYKIIAEMIPPGSSVLDIGCSEGELLLSLKNEKKCQIQGIEIDFGHIVQATSRGIPVIQHNVEKGMPFIPDTFYDYVILSRTLQVLLQPGKVLEEILRISKHAVVSFPNFGHYQIRSYLFFQGLMPKSNILPFEWYNTPNIHLITIEDFKEYCRNRDIAIEQEIYLDVDSPGNFSGFFNRLAPNLFAQYGIYLLKR